MSRGVRPYDGRAVATTPLVDRVFPGVLQRQLRTLLGAASARLLPRLAQAADKYQESERETNAQAERRREVAKSHIAALDGIEKDAGHLLKRLDVVTALIPEASRLGYLPVGSPSGTLGEPTAQVVDMRAKLDAIREAVSTASKADGEWRAIAALDGRRTRGRKTGGR